MMDTPTVSTINQVQKGPDLKNPSSSSLNIRRNKQQQQQQSKSQPQQSHYHHHHLIGGGSSSIELSDGTIVAVNEQLNESLDSFVNDVKDDALILIYNKMPEKLFSLDEYIKGNPWFSFMDEEEVFKKVLEKVGSNSDLMNMNLSHCNNNTTNTANNSNNNNNGSNPSSTSTSTSNQDSLTQKNISHPVTFTNTSDGSMDGHLDPPPLITLEKKFELLKYLHDDIRVLTNYLRNEIIGFLDILERIKLYIELNIPRIEDGNNFGVSIQEDTISELARVEESLLHIIDSLLKYYAGRAKLATKVSKYPDSRDYKLSLIEIDLKQLLHLKMNFAGTRNGYAVLQDMVRKNIDRIVKPRSSHTGSIY